MKRETKFTDKNGKYVYEGDIIQEDCYSTFGGTGKGVIYALNGCFVCSYGQDANGKDQFDLLHDVIKKREVIGNIHDNPELLI